MASQPTPQLRKRSSNFTKEEELLLLEEVEKHKSVIECKITNRVSCLEKNEAWKKIACNFNAKNNVLRNMDQIKCKYENLKTKTRKVAALNKANFKGTGGGPSTSTLTTDPVMDSVLNIINLKTVYGIPFVRDSDFVEEVRDEQHQIEIPEQMNEEMPTTIENLCFDLNLSQNSASSEKVPQPATSETNTIAEKLIKAVNKEITGPQTVKQNNVKWSNYTPNRLKQPVTKRLRPSMPNPTFQAKEDYYKMKTKLLEEEMNQMKKRAEKEEEEHLKKMILLDLQITQNKNNIT